MTEATEFSTKYMGGALVATPEAFIAAQEARAADEAGAVSAQIDWSLINGFHRHLANWEPEHGHYGIEEMEEAWQQAVMEA